MSRFTGRQHKGALRELRIVRRGQADERNARTLLHRRAGAYVMGFEDGCAEFRTRDGEQFGGITGTHSADDHKPWLRSKYSDEIVESLMMADVQ